MLLNSGDIFAGFTIERLLGQGGMGSVYLARHPRLDRLTALKLLQPDLFADASVRTRFEREADLAARLDHPSIVAVYDRGTEHEQAWICMQYVDGADAGTVDPLQVPPERAAQIIEGVAPALDYAHSMGVLHRDVKPANILLARSGGGHGEGVFLTDFGLARLRAETTRLTQTGMFTATLAFASPEQMTGADIDHRSDQYSLACALYWLLTGVAPFESPNPADIVHGNLQLAPPPLSVRRLGLPAALDTILGIAMAKQPAHRFGSCTEFAAAVRSAFTNPTAVPGHPGPGIAASAPYPVEPPSMRVSLEKSAAPPDPTAVTEPVGTPIAQTPNAGGAPAAGPPPPRYFAAPYPAPKKTSTPAGTSALIILLLVLVLGAGLAFVVLAFVLGDSSEDAETSDASGAYGDTAAAFPASIFTYAIPGAAHEIVVKLPPHEREEGENNGARHTAHWWSEPWLPGIEDSTNLMVSFYERAGGNALIVVSYSGSDDDAEREPLPSEEALLRWLAEVPLF